MRYRWTHKRQLSDATVHSLYCAEAYTRMGTVPQPGGKCFLLVRQQEEKTHAIREQFHFGFMLCL